MFETIKIYFNFTGQPESIEMDKDELILRALIEEYDDRVKFKKEIARNLKENLDQI